MEHASLSNTQNNHEGNDPSEYPQQSISNIITNTDPKVGDNSPDEKHNTNLEIPPPKKKYARITNEKRLELINSVENQGKSIKETAQKLSLNYSSAKSIFSLYQKEGRSLKKTYKQRFRNKNDSKINPELSNPPCENKELKKLLSTPTSQTSEDSQQNSRVVSQNGLNNQSEKQNLSNNLYPIMQPISFHSMPQQANVQGPYQLQQVVLVPVNFNNDQNFQMAQNNQKNYQHNQNTGYEPRKDNTNNSSYHQQQPNFIVHQGNMQPIMIMNSQPPFQNLSQGFIGQASNFNPQNQTYIGFNHSNMMDSHSFTVRSFTVNDMHQNQQMNMYPIMVQNTGPQYQSMNGDSNNFGMNNNMQQPTYYTKTFSASGPFPVQQGGFVIFGENQNEMQKSNQESTDHK